MGARGQDPARAPLKIAFVAQDGLSTVNFGRWFAQEFQRRSGVEFWTVSSRDLYDKEIAALGSRHVDLTTARFIRPLSDMLYAGRLYALARRERFDVLVSFGTKPNLFAPPAARLAGVPRVLLAVRGLGRTFGDQAGPSGRFLSAIVGRLYRLACRSAHRVWFTNPRDRARFIEAGLVGEEKTFLTTNSVNLEHFSLARVDPTATDGVRAELGLAKSDFVVIMVARLLRAKGVGEFLDAARILEGVPSLRFLLVATPEPNSPDSVPDAFVDELRRQPNLVWQAFRKDIRELYALADVAVLPSYYQEGGYPRALLEPMALAKPVIAADTPDCRGPVEEGGNGYLVPVRDAGALADRIERLRRDPDLRLRFGRRSADIARTRFDDRAVGLQVLAELGVG